MRVVTSEKMRELDTRAMLELGYPGVVLMENAGRAVVDSMSKEYGDLRGKQVAVYCGTGNNGGDGFVIARLLYLKGANPLIILVGEESAIKNDARTHFDLVKKLPLLRENQWQFDYIVDALIGTGLKEVPRSRLDKAIETINQASCPIISVDIPSGVNSNTGAAPGEAVRATHTVTFGYPKVGHFMFPGAELTGKLHISDIGLDWDILSGSSQIRLASFPSHSVRSNDDTWKLLVKKRSAETNKGDYGHIGILAGSRGMVGAAALVAKAAQRSGAGLVSVLTAASAQPMLASKLDEQVTFPLPESNGAISEDAYDIISKFITRFTMLCIGPGLTTQPGPVALVQRIVGESDMPIVLDADGLNALALKPELVMQRSGNSNSPLILTPHPGEAARLLGTTVAAIQSNRIEAVCQIAQRYRAIVILKGRNSLIADQSGNVTINTTGNPGMASGGMGDTLTGIIGALIAHSAASAKSKADGYPAFSAYDVATLGVHLHGLAGDLAANEAGEVGLIASDLISKLPAAYRMLEENTYAAHC